MAIQVTQTYLERFFDEKELNFQTFEVEHDGMTHFIDSETIIGLIFNAPENERVQIVRTLRKIDFANGDINHFLQHLATAYVKTNY